MRRALEKGLALKPEERFRSMDELLAALEAALAEGEKERKKALEELAKRYDEYVVDSEEQTIGIAHADCPEDAEYLIELLRRNHPPEEVLTVCYEPVTGSHVGPGTLALFFEAREGCRSM